MIEADRNSFLYEMRFLLNVFEKTIKFKIKNYKDIQCAIEKANGIPKIYVIIKPCQQFSQPFHEPIHQMLSHQDNFVQLLTA